MKGKNSKQEQQAAPPPNQLTFPDVTPLDHVKSCPRFTSVLNRADGDGVGIEEMDSLQMEIESLLVHVMQRNRQLKLETMVLDNWSGDKSESIIISSVTAAPSTPRASSFSTPSAYDKQQSSLYKKHKSFSGKPVTASASSKLNNSLSGDLPIVRNEIPDIFWKSVEPYCADITDEDIKMLESQLELNESYLNFPKLGPVGRHYSQTWAEADINQQIKEGARFTDLDTKAASTTTPQASSSSKRKQSAATAAAAAAADAVASATTTTTTTTTISACSEPAAAASGSKARRSIANTLIDDGLIKIGKSNAASGGGSSSSRSTTSNQFSYGPLTQRLISALIEQNLMTPFDTDITDYLERIGPPPPPAHMSPNTMARRLILPNGGLTSSSSSAAAAAAAAACSNSLERKIKRTLIEQGILDVEESESKGDTSGDDDNNHNNVKTEPVEQMNVECAQLIPAAAATAASVSNAAAAGVCEKEDEIAAEIRNVQNELRLVTKQCKQTLTSLLGVSRQQMTKQHVKKKVSAVDNEIIEIYEKWKAARQSKKMLSKKDKEKLYRLMAARESLALELQSV